MGSGAVDVHFRVYQQTESGSMDQSLRRVALTGTAIDKVPRVAGRKTDHTCLFADLRPVNACLSSCT